jgi:hypothetical protein
LEAKAELQKIAAFTAIEKRNFIEKKEIVAFHLNNNPFINSWLQNRLTIGRFASFN